MKIRKRKRLIVPLWSVLGRRIDDQLGDQLYSSLWAKLSLETATSTRHPIFHLKIVVRRGLKNEPK